MSRPSTARAVDDAGEGVPHPVRVRSLVGHATAERAFLDAYRGGRLHHAWLIGGPAGVGKATLAWHFARFLLAWPDPYASDVQAAVDLAVRADHPALQRMAAGSHGDLAVLERQWNDKTKKRFSEIRVDDVRDALGIFQRAAAAGGYRICIIDSAEDLNRSSANALLKAIEEPPPRSIFLIVAHRPGQVMPTIVSRCRRLILTDLAVDEVARAVAALGEPWASIDPARLREAATRARGSVGETLRLLDGGTLDLAAATQGLLRTLPEVDWRRVHRLADTVGMSDDLFDIAIQAIVDWLGVRLHERAAAGRRPRAIVPLAEAFEMVRSTAREASVLNLDKRPVLLAVFAELARCAKTGG